MGGKARGGASAVRMEKGGYLGDGFSRFALFVVEYIYEMIGAADTLLYGQPRREFVHRRR